MNDYPVLHVYDTTREARIAANRFTIEHDCDMLVQFITGYISVKTKENEHIFMDSYRARTWVIGREYYLDKPNTEKEFSYLYRSGYKVTK